MGWSGELTTLFYAKVWEKKTNTVSGTRLKTYLWIKETGWNQRNQDFQTIPTTMDLILWDSEKVMRKGVKQRRDHPPNEKEMATDESTSTQPKTTSTRRLVLSVRCSVVQSDPSYTTYRLFKPPKNDTWGNQLFWKGAAETIEVYLFTDSRVVRRLVHQLNNSPDQSSDTMISPTTYHV